MLQVSQKCNGNLCGKKQRRVGKNVSFVGGGGYAQVSAYNYVGLCVCLCVDL